ncbi:PHP domain-containing protein [Ruminiclostridium josui]|uniref:PHP domain-containing protein n=1 Tax=Ruminiclostridium josui TaxID=1499 RepID=UPI0004662D69|nr:PHP domain-containing protein [Ruminiclostridium josui]
MRIDMHVHTTESDGRIEINNLINLCKSRDVTAIGLADHWKTKRYSKDFFVDDIHQYIAKCTTLKQAAANMGINVYIGLEVDFSGKYGFDISHGDLEDFNMLDYILFEYVDTEKEDWGTVDGKSILELFKIREYLTVPVGLAHNNFARNFSDNIENIVKEMSERNIFLELCEGEPLGQKKVDASTLKKLLALKKNMSDLDIYKGEKAINRQKHMTGDQYYFETFPDEFWEYVQKYGLKLSLGTDCHSGTSFGKCTRAEKILEKYQLFHQLIFNTGMILRT